LALFLFLLVVVLLVVLIVLLAASAASAPLLPRVKQGLLLLRARRVQPGLGAVVVLFAVVAVFVALALEL
jgi:hypothetical protein